MASSRISVYLFAGDSLTEGVYGENYVERIAKALYQGRYGLCGEAINSGRGGDTVSSLLSRIDKPLHRYRPHWLILAVGCNDVWLPWLASHSAGWWLWLQYHNLRSGQKPTTDLDQFAAAYRALIDKACQVDARVLACTIAPLGEKLSSPINHRAARLNGVIKHVAAASQVPVADIWQASVERLALLPSRSGYLPGEWLFAWSDRRRMRKSRPDEVAERRRLYLTFDGIHLNSRGSDLWAETILRALAQVEGKGGGLPSDQAWQQDLSWFSLGSLHVCCSQGWEARAHDLAQLLTDAYDILLSRTGARPAVRLAVLNSVHWSQSNGPKPYPTPAATWDGETGVLFLPVAYEDALLRDLHLPETVASWISWPPDLAQLGGPARATALADLLAIEELSHLFLQELQVAPADPALRRMLTAYLAQVVFHAIDANSTAEAGAGMAALWNAWGEVLARAGRAEGKVRLQARALFKEHGDRLVTLFTGSAATIEEHMTSALASTPPQS
jgi:lysophospholipase L1-like esterase